MTTFYVSAQDSKNNDDNSGTDINLPLKTLLAALNEAESINPKLGGSRTTFNTLFY